MEDFNRQSNIFLANFKHANSNIRNVLFQNYCTSFYGSQILPIFGNCMDDIYTAWRVAIRRVWQIPWRTLNIMLPHIAGVMDPELWFARRCIKFIDTCLTSDNNTVKTISMMGVNGLYSVLGANYRILCTKYNMNVNNVRNAWSEKCVIQEEIIRMCEQVRELCEVRDRCGFSILNMDESDTN